jgi:hypothetical protein
LFTLGALLVIAGLALLLFTPVRDSALSLIAWWKGKPPAPHWPLKLHVIAAEFILGGALCLLVATVYNRLRSWLPPRPFTDAQLIKCAALVTLLLWLPVVLFGHSASIDGERFWWLGDDAMISMNYARNLAHGHGLVWNTLGERVEGYSNFLWTLVMAAVHLLHLPASKNALVISTMNVVITIAALHLLVKVVDALNGGIAAKVFVLLGLILNRNMMCWAISGYETALLAFLVLLSLNRISADVARGRPALATFLFISLVSLVRADGVILSFILFLIFALTYRRDYGKLILFMAIFMLLPAAHALFRQAYYGDPFPNTAYLKVMNWDERGAVGALYVVGFFRQYGILFIVSAVGLAWSRNLMQWLLMLAIISYSCFVAYVGGDAFEDYRFFVPVLPLLLILAGLGIQEIIRAAGRRRAAATWSGREQGACAMRTRGPAPALCLLCLLSSPLIVPGYPYFLRPFPGDSGNVHIGLTIKQNTPPGTTVADFWAGSVIYFSQRQGIDLLGKSDRHIAHMPAVPGELKPGHNKFDFEYSLCGLRPDLVVANFKLPDDEGRLGMPVAGEPAFTARLYTNDCFRTHCLPHQVKVDTWRSIFLCDWSPQLAGRANWREPPRAP